MGRPNGQKKAFTSEELVQLRARLDLQSDYMGRCLLDVAVDSMLRASDLAALRVWDFRSPNGQWSDTFTVQVKKTGEEVDCPVQEHTRKSLARYVEAYRLNDDSLLFPVSRKTLERYVKRWARTLGHDPRKYACHSLRRSKAEIMAHECSAADLDMIRISLGHAWLSSTQRYLGTDRTKALAFSRSFIV